MMFDLIFCTALAVFLFKGYRKGIVFAICSFLGILLGVMGALKLSGVVALHLFKDSNGAMAKWAPTLTYLILFILIVWLVRMVGSIVEKSMKTLMLGWFNKLAGALVYGLMIAFIWSSFLWLGSKVSLLNDDTLASSVTAPYILPLAPKMIDGIGAVLPFAKSIFGDIGGFYDSLNDKLTTHVGAH